MKRTKYKFSWKGKYIYIISFLIPVIVFFVYMYIVGLSPFGSHSLLLGDAHAQIYPFLLEMYHKVHNGDAFFYSWNMGVGTNYYANMVYYLMSPFNWLLMLLPEHMLEAGMSFSIVFRIALCAVTATFYFMHTDRLKNFRYQKMFSVLFGLCYGLSDAVICYFFLSMWLDVYYLLPLLLWALERLVKQDAWRWYYILLVIAICSNFYIAVPVCIFLVFWFLLQAEGKDIKRQFLRFAGTSLLSGMTAMVCILPVLYAIVNKKTMQTAYIYFKFENFIDVINCMLPMIDIDFAGSDFDTYNIYCGGICFFFALYYILFGREKKWVRIKYSVFMLFMLVSLNSHLLSFIWHGFSLPHGYNKRFAFLTVFVVIYVACMGLKSAMEGTKLQIVIWIVLSIALFFVTLLFNSKLGNPAVYIVTSFILAISAITVYLYMKKSISAKAYMIVFLVMGIAELTVNTGYNLIYLAVEDWRSITDYNAMEQIFQNQKLKTGRVVNDAIRIHNVGSAFGVNAGDAFSSLLDADILNLYENMGLYYMRSGAAYCYFGATPFTDFIFNVEKKITKNSGMYSGKEIKRTNGLPPLKKSIVEPIYDDIELRRSSEYSVLGGENTVGYGFASETSVDEVMLQNDSVFENQNCMFMALGGKDEIFDSIDLSAMEIKPFLLFIEQRDGNTFDYANSVISDLKGNAFENLDYHSASTKKEFMVLMHGTVTMTYEADRDIDDLYLYINNTSGAILSVKLDNRVVSDFDSIYYNMVVHVGSVKEGQIVEIVTSNNLVAENKGTMQIFAANFNENAFSAFYNQVKDSSLQVKEMDGSGLKGEFTAEKDGSLYISAVDDGGFSVYIDGKKTKHEKLAECMVWVPITAGTHTVELRYNPPGFQMGLAVSLLSLCGIAILWNWDKIKKKRQA